MSSSDVTSQIVATSSTSGNEHDSARGGLDKLDQRRVARPAAGSSTSEGGLDKLDQRGWRSTRRRAARPAAGGLDKLDQRG
ncbi:hypothetical protein A5777_21220 [Gordonia sp. 852002-10350_SCH5691597]|nr:hypothetical protein A5777_21220 [Gordonia sp. 852002-10350_SCH5691597]